VPARLFMPTIGTVCRPHTDIGPDWPCGRAAAAPLRPETRLAPIGRSDELSRGDPTLTDLNIAQPGSHVVESFQSPDPLPPWERAMALATIELVAAFRHLQTIPPDILPWYARSPFESMRSGLCMALDAVDVLGPIVWDESTDTRDSTARHTSRRVVRLSEPPAKRSCMSRSVPDGCKPTTLDLIRKGHTQCEGY
jgi:hypothetical protein